DLSRINYLWRMDGNTCRLKPLGRKVILQMPKTATRLIIDNPRNLSCESWQILSADGAPLTTRAGGCVALQEAYHGVISIQDATVPAAAVENTAARPMVTALLRRLLTEGRDRFLS